MTLFNASIVFMHNFKHFFVGVYNLQNAASSEDLSECRYIKRSLYGLAVLDAQQLVVVHAFWQVNDYSAGS